MWETGWKIRTVYDKPGNLSLTETTVSEVMSTDQPRTSLRKYLLFYAINFSFVITLKYVTIATRHTLYLTTKFTQANHPISDSQATNFAITVDKGQKRL